MTAARTPVCELLGIDQPVVLAPMVAVPALAAAVSNAGALGMLTLTWSDDVAAVIRETAALTGRPFCGNLVLTEDRHDRLAAALDAGLRLVSFFLGDPSDYVEQVHQAGGLVLHTVGTAEEARRAVAAGVDVIVAQGWEAGGHVWGTIATLPLIPAVVDAVAPVPVIAAGGIGDGRGVAAVLALGAQAAWLGTRFLLAEEMPIHPDYRRRLIAAAETGPQRYPDLYSVDWPDSPHRALRNSTSDLWQSAGCPPLAQRPGVGEVIAHFASGEAIVRYEPAPPMAGTTGDIEALSMWAGQSVALARGSQPAADIVAELTSRLLPRSCDVPSQEMQDAIGALWDRRKASAGQPTPSLAEFRAAFTPADRLYPVSADVLVTDVIAGGVPAHWLDAPGADPGRVLLFLHGGGFELGSVRSDGELAARLGRASGMRVLFPEYRLAPEHPFPAALDDILAAWHWLRTEQSLSASSAAVAGDSAGGGLAVSLLVATRDAAGALPAAAVLMSPTVDLTSSGASMTERADQDPISTPALLRQLAAGYLAGADPKTPLASPLFAELAGLPPLLIQVGTADLLLSDSERLAAAATDAGVDVTLRIGAGLPHVYPLLLGTPEAAQATAHAGAFLRARVR